MQKYRQTIDTPLGKMTLVADDDALLYALFESKDKLRPPEGTVEGSNPVLAQAEEELAAYFAGRLRDFAVPCNPAGTQFQQEVWQALRRIPYGKTKSYAEIAVEIGRPQACRAVGQANNKNPLALFVPCHRVIGADGRLVGYASGTDKKEALLRLEKCGK